MKQYELENQLMNEAFRELKSNRRLSESLSAEVDKVFGDRFRNGWQLAKSGKVRRYQFRPSERLVWVVEGRKGEYQVMPDIPFCYCDDYYFRVMDRKRGLCYHIIAQRISEALGQYRRTLKKDSQYSAVTSRWRAKDTAE